MPFQQNQISYKLMKKMEKAKLEMKPIIASKKIAEGTFLI